MSDPELSYLPAAELARRLHARQVSAVEAVQNALARIAEVNPALNFCTDVYAEQALDAAGEADRREPTGRLHGVPFALKDVTPARGQLVTYGSHAFDLIPSRDAVIAARLQAAGAILVARTTTPELAHSSYTRSPRFGVTRNPWNPSRTPGGSSGGSAVAVATGCVPFAEGSDMGGSIRIPASYCGIVGLKPSFGRIPLEFLPSLVDHIHHVGPLARTCDDARLFLAVTQGPDDRDPLSLPGVLDLDRPLSGDVRGLRLALSIDLASYAVHPRGRGGRAARSRRAARRRRRGRRGGGGLHPGAAAGLVRPLGRLPRQSCCGERLDDFRDQLDPVVLELVERGRAANAVQERARFDTAVREAWEALRTVHREHAALLCPTMALPPPAAETSAREEDLDMTTLFNLTSPCPALSVPCGFHSDGLPIGLQIVARRHRDDLARGSGPPSSGPSAARAARPSEP